MPQALSEGLAGELSVGLGDLFRGVEVNQSEPGLRGYVEYSAANGLYAGLWAGSYNVPADSRSTEVNYLLGYNHRLSSAIAFDTAIVRYEYPGAPSWLRDYDWTEWLSSLHIGDRWIFTYGLSDNWLVPEGRTHSGWITYQFPLPRQLTLDLKAGAVRIAEGGLVDGYQFYELGLSRTIGSFGGRVAVATTDQRLQRALGDEMAGVHASLQLSWFF
jgi:uncharacterized protein (TIGR02001 family)